MRARLNRLNVAASGVELREGSTFSYTPLDHGVANL
jgi:hypothetical protein